MSTRPTRKLDLVDLGPPGLHAGDGTVVKGGCQGED